MDIKFTQFEELTKIIDKLGFLEESMAIIKDFDTKFITISKNADEIYSNDSGNLFTILPDLSIRRLVIYIADLSNYRRTWYSKGLPKYHPYECETIKQMKYEGRGHRYVSTGKDDGNFWTINTNNIRKYTKRQICKHCYKKYKKDHFNEFNLKEYLNNNASVFEPFDDYIDSNDVTPKNYPKNWSEISKKMKKQFDYVCQKCNFNGVSLERKQYIDCHHNNADRSNNNKNNLKILCVGCHAKEFKHSHMKSDKRYIDFIDKYKQ